MMLGVHVSLAKSALACIAKAQSMTSIDEQSHTEGMTSLDEQSIHICMEAPPACCVFLRHTPILVYSLEAYLRRKSELCWSLSLHIRQRTQQTRLQRDGNGPGRWRLLQLQLVPCHSVSSCLIWLHLGILWHTLHATCKSTTALICMSRLHADAKRHEAWMRRGASISACAMALCLGLPGLA